MTRVSEELNYVDFTRACKRHQADPSSHQTSSQEENGLVLYSAGPNERFAVFQESDGVGRFFLYDARQQKVLKAAHIYSRRDVAVEDDVVDIGWAADDSVCGLALWGEFRAFLGVSSDLQMTKPVLHADEDGIPANEWPAGFEHYLEKKFD